MRVEATGRVIDGKVKAPPSKSAMQRYLAGALLSEGVSRIYSDSLCDDSTAAIGIVRALGAKVAVTSGLVEVQGGFKPAGTLISCGESGLSARMFTPIAALHDSEITISGEGSLLKRPFSMTEEPLARLGVEVVSNRGYLPLKVKGPLRGGDVSTEGSVSSQFITGLLLALPAAGNDSRVYVENLVSRPYIDLTISILKKFAIEVVNDGYSTFHIKGRQKYLPGNFTVEGDWSGASFLMVMGAIAGEVIVHGLDINSTQADREIIRALGKAGATVSVAPGSVRVSKGNLRGFRFDISDCPDLAPPLAVLALACRGKSIISGAGRLLAKESNRASALEDTFTSVGARFKTTGDNIEIDGGHRLTGGAIDAHNDHRIAMALAVAALMTSEPVVINGMESINKSYPGFIEDYRNLGGEIKLV